MKQFMVVFQLRPDVVPAEVAPLMPAEQARTAELLSKKILLGFYLVQGAPKAFLHFQTESQEELEKLLHEYPLYPHATWEINPLVESPRS